MRIKEGDFVFSIGIANLFEDNPGALFCIDSMGDIWTFKYKSVEIARERLNTLFEKDFLEIDKEECIVTFKGVFDECEA